MALRYVVLWHSGIDQPHYDLMFETAPGSALATWRSSVWPIAEVLTVTKLRDHRSAFLHFEGLLSQDRGAVTQVASGSCEVEIKEVSEWFIRLMGDSAPTFIRLHHVRDETWEAEAIGATEPQ